MATPECIEPVQPNSSPDATETPVSSPPPIQFRHLTVSSAQIGPFLRLRGRWLEKAGFPTGMGIDVYVTHGLLVIQARPRKSDPPSVIKRQIPALPSAEVLGILDAFAAEWPESEASDPAPEPDAASAPAVLVS